MTTISRGVSVSVGPEDAVETGDERRLPGAAVASDGDEDRSFAVHGCPGA